jgi:hypothetical protein
MSASLFMQTLGWVPVVWLVTTHLLVERGKLPRDGVALRIAGCAAAAVVITAAVVADMWPVAALGLLWLRTEVFAHRHPIHEFQAHREQVRRERAERNEARHELEQDDQADQPVLIPREQPAEPEPAFLREVMQSGPHAPTASGQTALAPKTTTLPRPRRNARPTARAASSLSEAHPSGPGIAARPGRTPSSGRPVTRTSTQRSGHAPAQKSAGSRVVDAIFKIEVVVVVIIVLVGIGVYAQHQKYDFNRKANASLCKFMGDC